MGLGEYALEMISTTRVQTIIVRRERGGKRLSTEPSRPRRYYKDRDSMNKDHVFLVSRTWPTCGWKRAQYIAVYEVSPFDGIVWC